MTKELVGALALAALFSACSNGNGKGAVTASGGTATNGEGGGTPGGSGGASNGGTAASTGGTASNGSAGGGAGGGGAAASTGGATNAGGVTSGGATSSGGGVNASSGGAGSGGGSGSRWVGTWSASPYPVDANNQPPVGLANSVLRQVVHVSLGGSQIRVQFSNLNGSGAVTISSAHVALCKASPAVDSSIDPATDKALAFSGMGSVTIAQGKEVWSDPLDFALPALGNVSITTAFGSVPTSLTGHAGARTTSYVQSGSSNVSATSMSSAQTKDAWYYISGMDVMADASARAMVAIGDSITDGRGTDTNKNTRWTDYLSARLQASASGKNVGVLNQGIGATNLVGTSGTAAQARFARDVLGQSGVKYVIVLDGVNDIGGGASFAALKSAYDDLISRAHGKGLKIYGATILPFGAYASYATHDSVRLQVNEYIKSGVFDGFIDFESLGDGGNPAKLLSTYATWAQTDGLHPNPTGYQKMGDLVDLSLLDK
ncbi:MAG: GDSL-type esterase/lipase family protein [Polyangiaceae bacterium]